MSKRSPPFWARYGVAILSISAAIGLRIVLRPILGEVQPFSTVFLAILFSAWYGGFGPTLLTAFLGAVAVPYFLLNDPRPPGSFPLFGVLFYWALSFGIAWLGGLMASARQRLAAQAEETHRKKEELQATLSSIGDAVIVADDRGLVTSLNPVAQSLTGWTTGEAAGRAVEEVFHIVNEETRGEVESPVARVLREGTIVGLANHTVLIAKDGTERPIDDSAAPIRNDHGRLVGVVLVFRDISERRALERRRSVRLAVTQALAQAGDLREVVPQILQAVCEGLDWRVGALWFVEPRPGIIRCFDAWRRAGGPGEKFLAATRQAAFPPGDSLPGRVWSARQSVWIADVTTDERFVRRAAAIEENLHGAFACPIYVQNEVLGVVEFFSERIREPDADVLEMMTTLGGQIGLFVRRRRAEEERVRSERELSDFFQNATLPLHWTDPAGVIVRVNQAALDLLGFSREELVGRHIAELHVDQPAINDILTRLARGETISNYETRLRCRDGSIRDVLVDSSALWDEGRFVHTRCFTRDITEHKRAEEKLRVAAQRLQLALEAGRMGVWQWDMDSGRVEWSDNLESIHGLALGTFGGTFEAFRKLVHPDDWEMVQQALERAIAEQETYEVEFRNIWPDGSLHWIAGKGRIQVEDGKARRMVGVAQDVTERKQAEQTAHFLADASEALSSLVDLKSTLERVARLSVPFFADWCLVDLVDADGALQRLAIAHVDPAKVQLAQEVYQTWPAGMAGEEGGPAKVMRTGCAELIPEISDEMLARTIADPELLALMRKLGLRSYIGAPLAVRGKVLGVLNFISAESGRRYGAGDLEAAEDLAHRAAVAIENSQLYQSLREVDRRKDEFLAVLAHELRNPLAPLASALHIMKLPAADAATIGEARDVAQRQLNSLTRLVDDLLDVSRVMRGKIELRKERVELAAIVWAAVETAQPLVKSRGHQLTVSLPDEPVWLEVDVVRIAQVLSNLLSNAAKYTEPPGNIWFTASREGNQIVFSVRDTGIGIASEVLPSLFKLFMQVAPGTTRSQGGLGIGLTLVKSLVELHGGTVDAHSAGLGQGSEFVVKVPAAVEVDRDKAPEEHRPEAKETASGRRVLVVDDNVDAAESMAILLRLMGHDVRTVHGGEAALEAVAADQPQLVLLDIGMPGMNGYEVARRLRADYGPERLTLVALTGWGQEQDRRRSKEVGFDHHLTKPVELATLQEVLSNRQLQPI